MLAFAAKQGVKPIIEKFELSDKGIGEAMERLNGNKMRYRGVLVAKDA
jgi:D-arabinose 1-dehydrogenase-like Zn-dependent alcohol dehydrogenase